MNYIKIIKNNLLIERINKNKEIINNYIENRKIINNKIMKDLLIKRCIINIKISNKNKLINNNHHINLKNNKDKDKIIIEI